ncbi:MAG: ABC transporter permease [Betaproteobacteria bacterium]|nr:ABC transporter permease [Betaproteobacteria bacterium]
MQPASAQAVLDPQVTEGRTGDGAPAVTLSGAWDIRALEARARMLTARLRLLSAESSRHWDLSRIQRLDHIGALLIWQAWGKRRPGRLALAPGHEVFFSNLDAAAGAASVAPFDPLGLVRGLGARMLHTREHLLGMVELIGQILIDSLSLIRHPLRGPWREISASVFRVGTQALGITALVGFLIGVVLSYLSAEQLKAFGANIFIINLLGMGIIRELGPVIAAVLVAGRSGSAITAQLGVMRVTEELDALSVMGIPHTVRLILPKIVALAIAMPLLILWSSGIALIGGAIAASTQLGISVNSFMSGLPGAVPTVNLWLAMGKGIVFGALIALVACHFGLRVQPNTESLGIGTTNSVVTSITAVIIADAIFAVIFSDVGISLS